MTPRISICTRCCLASARRSSLSAASLIALFCSAKARAWASLSRSSHELGVEAPPSFAVAAIGGRKRRRAVARQSFDLAHRFEQPPKDIARFQLRAKIGRQLHQLRVARDYGRCQLGGVLRDGLREWRAAFEEALRIQRRQDRVLGRRTVVGHDRDLGRIDG